MKFETHPSVLEKDSVVVITIPISPSIQLLYNVMNFETHPSVLEKDSVVVITIPISPSITNNLIKEKSQNQTTFLK